MNKHKFGKRSGIVASILAIAIFVFGSFSCEALSFDASSKHATAAAASNVTSIQAAHCSSESHDSGDHCAVHCTHSALAQMAGVSIATALSEDEVLSADSHFFSQSSSLTLRPPIRS